MWKSSALSVSLLSVALLALAPECASALEVKNARPSYGPLGATRPDSKFLPGDVLFIHYDIEGLTPHAKTGKVGYFSELEFLDSKGKSISSKKSDTQSLLPDLGPKSVAGVMNAVMGEDQKPGKYTVKLKVTDVNSKKTTEFSYPFELLPKGFGAIRVLSPAFGVPGGEGMVQFVLVELPLDKKGNPNIDITMTITEDGSKTPLSKKVISFPKELPDDVNLQKQNFVPVVIPISNLNRSGRFMINVDMEEKNQKRNIKLQFPLTVVDLK
jgi:hypothetical protein